jgi:phage tail sheath protein FI
LAALADAAVPAAAAASPTFARRKYVNVRRRSTFIEQSIDEDTQWAVFEPNRRSDPRLA